MPDRSQLKTALSEVLEINDKSGVPVDVYVVEECSELIKALTKRQRGKGSEEDVLSESCDVLATVFMLLLQSGASEQEVRERILRQCRRALDRYQNKGEI